MCYSNLSSEQNPEQPLLTLKAVYLGKLNNIDTNILIRLNHIIYIPQLASEKKSGQKNIQL